MGRHDDDSSSEAEDHRKRSRKSHKKSSSRYDEEDRRTRKRKRAKADRRRDDDDVNSTRSSTPSASSSDHQRQQKSRRREDSDIYSDESDHRRSRKRKKKDKKQRRKEEKSSKRRSTTTTKTTTIDDDPGQERQYQFVDALHDLFDDHPALSTDLPIMLIRMASGASLDLSQMSDTGAAQRLENIFQKLIPFGVMKDQRSWTWKSPGGANTNTELLLVRIARSLLDQVGVTMEAVSNFGRKDVPVSEVKAPVAVVKGPTRPPTAIQLETTAFLEQFGKKQNEDSPSLAEELTTLCQMIVNGESIAIDGIPDDALRLAMEAIFVKAGLEIAEIGNEDSDDEDDDEPTMGYGLPDGKDHQIAHSNMMAVIEACQSIRPIPRAAAAADSDNEDGPAPVGKARAPTMDLDRIKAMAAQRKEELDHLDPNYVKPTRAGDREEWMLTPGEHDFLQGITSGISKTRNFQNKKVHDRAPTHEEEIMDPKIQAEVDAIYAAHREARGPSLMDQHRGKVAEEKAAKAAASQGGGFGWNRDKDLDAGRRVDKDALKMILGGAGSELKDKFQGGYGRS